jgi:uncharacterized protein (TIGR00725 family)
MRVSVIGGSTVTDAEYERAREVGRLLGGRGHELVCGGRGGVMAAACRGIQETGGHAIGILPGGRAGANEYVDTAIATRVGNARNPLVVMNGDAVIAVDGGPGTLSELGHALDFGRPVAGLGTHQVEGGGGSDAGARIEHVDSPEAAVDYVERAVGVD